MDITPIRRRGFSRQKPLDSELLPCVVAAFDEEFLEVVDVSEYRFAEVGWHNEYSVVIGRGIVDLNLLSADDGLNHLHNLLGQGAGVLKDGHGLVASDDVLGVGDVAVLTGDQR